MTVIEPNGYFENGVWINGLNKSMIGKRIIRLEPCHCNPNNALGGYYDFSFCLIGCFGDDRREIEGSVLKDIVDGKLILEPSSSIFTEPHTLELWWNDGNWIAHSDIERFRNNWIGKIGKIHPLAKQASLCSDCDEDDLDYIEIECPYCNKISSHKV